MTTNYARIHGMVSKTSQKAWKQTVVFIGEPRTPRLRLWVEGGRSSPEDPIIHLAVTFACSLYILADSFILFTEEQRPMPPNLTLCLRHSGSTGRIGLGAHASTWTTPISANYGAQGMWPNNFIGAMPLCSNFPKVNTVNYHTSAGCTCGIIKMRKYTPE